MRRLIGWREVCVATTLALQLVALSLLGCSSFLHFSDPSVQAVTCGISNMVLGPLESLAVTLGLPLWVVEDLYSAACAEAAKAGMTQEQAEKFGLQHAQMHGMQLKKMKATFAAERPQ